MAENSKLRLSPSEARFIGREDIFRCVAETDVASHGTQADAMPVVLA